jgi:succinyl-CoA synthetase alpha subunit
MSILLDETTRIVVQGFGRAGSFHAQQCKDYGAKIVGAVHPGKGGTEQNGTPIFNTMREAVDAVQPTASIVFVPASGAADAIIEAADGGLELVVCITEGIPTQDLVKVSFALEGSKTRLLGPNCPGLISPGKSKLGIMPGYIHKQGHVGVVSRSGTLTYEAVGQLSALGIGQSTCVGIGGDPIIGTKYIDALKLYKEDPDTHAVIMIGEIGGTAEEEAAAFIKEHFTKPVAAFIAGRTAPPGRRMGHAGAIISGGKGTASEKVAALEDAGIAVAPTPGDMGTTLAGLL